MTVHMQAFPVSSRREKRSGRRPSWSTPLDWSRPAGSCATSTASTSLSDIAPSDYLGWGEQGVAGYIGTASGRDLNEPGSQGLAHVPAPKPKRFSVSYQLLRVGDDPTRVCVQVWLDDGEPIASVLSVWPAADWFEREAWDMMGISFEGHPNLVRILMPEDWEGHPLRKDYPLGGEPVRFSDED